MASRGWPAAEARAGDHVGRRRPPHEQVPRRRGARRRWPSVRRERTALAAVREPFKDAFGPHCFYCGTHLPANNPIDHVLPWSLVGIDGLANLVLACARCNGDKSGALPAVAIVDRVLERERRVLEEIAVRDCVADPTRPGRGGGARHLPRATAGCRRGRGTSGASGWISVSRRGGRESSFSASVRLRRAALAAPVTRVTNLWLITAPWAG